MKTYARKPPMSPYIHKILDSTNGNGIVIADIAQKLSYQGYPVKRINPQFLAAIKRVVQDSKDLSLTNGNIVSKKTTNITTAEVVRAEPIAEPSSDALMLRIETLEKVNRGFANAFQALARELVF